MYRQSTELFAADIYRNVVDVLEDYFADHEMTSMEASRIATVTEQAFRAAMEEHFDLPSAARIDIPNSKDENVA